jgi:Zn-dependent protease
VARDYAPIQPESGLRSRARKLLAPLAVLVALLLKLKAVLLVALKLPVLATSASMLVSVAGYAVFWGWRFALGFVALLLVHELGHVLEARRQGLATGGVYFVPFLGAVMLMKQQSKDAGKAAWLGLAGPILGSAAAAATWAAGVATGSGLLVALAFTGFLLNLFNLIPVMPLDGGWATAVFHPLFWAFGLAGVVMLFAVFPNPILLIVAAFGAWELWRRWKRRGGERTAYHDVSPRQRAAIAVVYLGLAGLLALGIGASHRERTVDGRVASAPPPALVPPLTPSG